MAQKSTAKHVLVTGSPGVGKTSLIRKVVAKLKEETSFVINGFYTEEVRRQGVRDGFDVVSLTSNKHGILARKCETAVLSTGPRGRMPMVGQYCVDIKSFENIALVTLDIKESPTQILVVDEIGKMELFSNKFCSLVKQAFESKDAVILATVPISKGKPIRLIEDIKARPDCTLLTVTKINRESLVNEVIGLLGDSCQSRGNPE